MKYETTIDRLKAIMEDKGISRKKLALDLGINRNTINSWFSVKSRSSMRQETITKIAKYLNVEPLWLGAGISEKSYLNTQTPIQTECFTKLCTFNVEKRIFEPLDTGAEVRIQTYDFDGNSDTHVAYVTDTPCKEYGIMAGDILFIRKQPTTQFDNGIYFISNLKAKTVQFVTTDLFGEKITLSPSGKEFSFSELNEFLFFKVDLAIKKF